MIKTILVLCVAVAVVNAGIYGGHLVGPSAPGIVLRGPSAKGSVTGPDGSHIHAYIPGGKVVAGPRHGGVVSGSVVPGHIDHGHWGGHWGGHW